MRKCFYRLVIIASHVLGFMLAKSVLTSIFFTLAPSVTVFNSHGLNSRNFLSC
jgi:hypothetical protein